MSRQSRQRRWIVLVLAGAAAIAALLPACAESGGAPPADPDSARRAALEEKYGLEPPGSAPQRGALQALLRGDWGVFPKLPQLRADAGA